VRTYTPQAGDVVWLDFDPQTGREQRGHRPGLVLSPHEYNRKTGLALVCPITSQIKGYPFEVRIQGEAGIDGVVLSDHIKNLDWRARNAKYVCTVSDDALHSVRNKIVALLTHDSPVRNK
jgi:mRNA interferase MazF